MSHKEDAGLNRRTVLKSAAIGSLSLVGMTGTGTATKILSNVEAESLIEIEEVQAIKNVDPDLKLKTHQAKAIGKSDTETNIQNRDKFIVGIPANHGDLLIHNDGNEIEAILYFDGYYPAVNGDWPKNTNAKITAKGLDAKFQREATVREKESVLSRLENIDGKNMKTSLLVMNPVRGDIPLRTLIQRPRVSNQLLCENRPKWAIV